MSAHADQLTARRLLAIAGLDSAAYVAIWPDLTTNDSDLTTNTIVDAAHPGTTSREFAYALRQLADRFDARADAVGEPPFDADTLAEANARNAEAGR
ncbi:hypothetical protein HXS80_20615 [Streptomyces sp. CB04723]|uniref:hypothetical protein n=1 Tax=Streptomyces TaxID=1883 RepID=UPI0015C4E1F1|nr:hypothetical protein [Streptomyces sp. CB04723]QLG33807.1 hypothetical protein HXS80_20615 [Streptomyces sp. CB04723]